MFILSFRDDFSKSMHKLRDPAVKEQIWKKIKELKVRAPIGKKLTGNPYWSIHVYRFRIIYKLDGNQVTVCELLERKYSYRELSSAKPF